MGLLLLSVPGWYESQQRNSGGFQLEISSKGAGIKAAEYVRGKQIPLQCRLKNVSGKKKGIVWPESGSSQEALPYPLLLTTRVRDESGKVLTENDRNKEGWWSWYFAWQDEPKEKARQPIQLNPDEELVRIVPLDTILWGCPSLPQGLEAGTFKIQLALGEIVSNELEIIVAAPAEKSPQ
jgi:hypothetical protein